MKLTKYTFRTPLFGSVQSQELLFDTDGRFELSSEQMCKLYDRGEQLMMFLTENSEDLAHCVPEELKDVVIRAEFGDCAMLGGRMYLRTYIWSTENLPEQVLEIIEEWITGQMSDGWGESLEQKEWKRRTIYEPTLYFDEYSLDFEEGEIVCQATYHVHPWNSEDYEIFLEDVEDVEEDLELKVVATLSLPYHNRQVIKLSNRVALKLFLKDFGRPDITATIEDSCMIQECSFYLVRDFEGDSGVEILPRWACEHGKFCSLYDMSVEEDVRAAQMPVSKAVLELLK